MWKFIINELPTIVPVILLLVGGFVNSFTHLIPPMQPITAAILPMWVAIFGICLGVCVRSIVKGR